MPNYDDTHIYFPKENLIFERVIVRQRNGLPCTECGADGEDFHDPSCPVESCPVCLRHSMDKEEVPVETGMLEDLQAKYPTARTLSFSGKTYTELSSLINLRLK